MRRDVPAWDTLLGSLRSALNPTSLHDGCALVDLRQDAEKIICEFAISERGEFDLLIAADGIGSFIRRRVLPSIEPEYAGYFGYRGLVPESFLIREQLDLIRDCFVLYAYPRSHSLNGTRPGQ